jgi:hypothetical protein
MHGANDQNNYFLRSFNFLSRELNKYSVLVNNYVLSENNLHTMYTFYFFIMFCLFTTTYLPYERFYNRVHGNHAPLIHYSHVFAYL